MAGNKYLVGAAALLVVFSTISSAFGQLAGPCNETACALPNCRCSKTETPGNLAREQTPQLVFLSFDAAVNVDNFEFYREALFSRKNPNGHPVTATFFVSHDYTVYSMLHELWRKGHEIGLHSISGNSSQAYWQSLNATMWRQELVDQREQINSFARIPASDIKGVRAPQLILGGDPMYSVLKQARLQYDCTRTTLDGKNVPVWPYTNDFESNLTKCENVGSCPLEQHPGFWTVPITNLDSEIGTPCSLADQCTPVPNTEESTYNLLYDNFVRHYNGDRTPFGIYTRHGWVNGTGDVGRDEIWQRRLGYFRFLDYLGTRPDVYIVGISRGLQWIQDPTEVANLPSFLPFQVSEKPDQCPRVYSCLYREGQTPFKPPLAVERWFHSCIPCPVAYPFVGNHLGRNRYEDTFAYN